jgi:hypothetical protein
MGMNPVRRDELRFSTADGAEDVRMFHPSTLRGFIADLVLTIRDLCWKDVGECLAHNELSDTATDLKPCRQAKEECRHIVTEKGEPDLSRMCHRITVGITQQFFQAAAARAAIKSLIEVTRRRDILAERILFVLLEKTTINDGKEIVMKLMPKHSRRTLQGVGQGISHLALEPAGI